MRIVFMGTPEFSVPILESLIENYKVVLVVTQPDKLVGRKKQLEETPVKKCALKHNIPVFQPTAIKEDYEPIVNANPDIIITAAFGQFIPKIVLECAPYKAINVHGSLLPKYRGGSPIQTAIIKGEKETGITIMYMASKMDAGDIIVQKSLPITDSDDNGTMFNKLSILGRDLLLETLPSIFDKTNPRIPQDESKVTYAYNISHEEQFIDWNKSSKAIYNLVRGLAPNPSALTSVDEVIYKIFKVEIVDYQGDEECGTILDLNKKILVKTLDGAISIKELQQAGKNKMDVKSYLNGQKILSIGCKFSNNIL